MIAWPTVPAPAPPLDNPTVELPSGLQSRGLRELARSGGIANLTGVPAISMPVGLERRTGSRSRSSCMAAWGRDELLLDAAEALERATDRRHVEARPDAAAA